VIDVKGDTVVTMSIPYMHEMDYLPIIPYHTVYPPTSNPGYLVDQLDFCNGMFCVYLMNGIVGSESATNASVALSMFVALDESSVLYHPTDLPQGFVVTYENSGDKKVLAKVQSGPERNLHDTRKIFEQVFPPIIDAKIPVRAGYVFGEVVDDIRTLLRRFYKFHEGWQISVNLDWREATSYNNTFSNLIRMYCFARGGIRWMATVGRSASNAPTGALCCTLRQIIPPMSDSTTPVERTSPSSGAPGFAWIHTANGRALQVEVPYSNNVNFVPTNLNLHTDEWYNMLVPLFFYRTDNTGTSSPSSMDYWVAAADDFTLGWLKTPPHVMFTITPAVRKRSAK
jgi:hypothetical protein